MGYYASMGNDFDDLEELSVGEKESLSGLPGQYSPLRLIGRGGSGIVIRAKDLQLDRDLAVKILSLSSDLSFPKRFVREAKILASVQNSHVVRILRSGLCENGSPFHVMELLEGETLAGKIQRVGKIPLSEILEIFRQALDGLEAVHAVGLVHRDLKPRNIMICRDDAGQLCVKLIDFGIARWVDGSGGATLTQTNVLLGSPLYMSPEQCKGSPSVDCRSDIYSLACVMYECLSGNPPFSGDSDMDLMYKHLHAQPEKLVVGNAGKAMNSLLSIVEQCLRKDPEARVQTAAEMRKRLEQIPAELESGNEVHRSKTSPAMKMVFAFLIIAIAAFALISSRHESKISNLTTAQDSKQIKVKRLCDDIERVGERIKSSLKKTSAAHFDLPAELISDCKILGNKSLELRSLIGNCEMSTKILGGTINSLNDVIARADRDTGSQLMPVLKRARCSLELGRIEPSESDFLEALRLVSKTWGEGGQEWRDVYMQYLSCLIEERRYDEANAGLDRLRSLWFGKGNPGGTWSSTQFLEPSGETRMQILRNAFDHLSAEKSEDLGLAHARIRLLLNLQRGFLQTSDKKYAREALHLIKKLIEQLPEKDPERVKFLRQTGS